ncbi:uncharacterized protein LOC135378396 [Ornithodoros turicata]|uniref:uncharacterized protein LOC135378396 n=1 Tax=Ornithodoros turicata TaxID=34597 RepID=UPI003139BEE2
MEFFDNALGGSSDADHRPIRGTSPHSMIYLWRPMNGFFLGDSSLHPLQDRVVMPGKSYLYPQSILDMTMGPFQATALAATCICGGP